MILIAIEGPDGSGKSTLTRSLSRALQARGVRVTATAEPWRTPAGDRVRVGMGSLRDAQHDRDAHTRAVIAPGLRQRQVILTDRYYASTVIHQGAEWDECAARWPAPDLWIYCDTPPEACLKRILSRGEVGTLSDCKGLKARYDSLPWRPVVVGYGVEEDKGAAVARVLSAYRRAAA